MPESVWPSLHQAAGKGDVGELKRSLNPGTNVDVNAGVEAGYTPLYLAISGGHLEAVRLLLENGANPDLGNRYVSALHLAIYCHWIEVVKLLLEKGANPNRKNEFGTSPLELARRYGYRDIAEILLQYGAV